MSQKRILVVEDNPTNMLLISEILKAEGYQVIQTTMAQEVMKLAREENPSLILLDIQLPGTDGFDVLDQLKADPKTGGIPVAALTAYARPEDIERGREAGFDAYITKPIDTRAFRKSISELLLNKKGLAKEKENE